jgi:hypothetical protein
LAPVQQFVHHPGDHVQRQTWDDLTQPVLSLRGEHSDLLLPAVAGAMRARPAGGGGDGGRLRPRTGAQHTRAVCAGGAFFDGG